MELSGADFQVRESQFYPSVWVFSFILHYAAECASLSFYIQYTFNISFSIISEFSTNSEISISQMYQLFKGEVQADAQNIATKQPNNCCKLNILQ